MAEFNTQYPNVMVPAMAAQQIVGNQQRNALLGQEQELHQKKYSDERSQAAGQTAALWFDAWDKLPEEEKPQHYSEAVGALGQRFPDVEWVKQLPPQYDENAKKATNRFRLEMQGLRTQAGMKRAPERPIAVSPGGSLVDVETGKTWTAPEKEGFHVLPEGSVGVTSTGKQVATGQPKAPKEADTDKAIAAAHKTISDAEYHKGKILSGGPTIEQQYVAKVLGVDLSKQVSKEDQDRMIKAYDDQITHARSIIDKHKGVSPAYSELQGAKPGWKYNPDLNKSVYWDGTKVTKEQQGKRQ